MSEGSTPTGGKWDAPNQVIHAPRERVCARPGCGVTYIARSEHGKYCSPYCRIKDHRAHQREDATPVPAE